VKIRPFIGLRIIAAFGRVFIPLPSILAQGFRGSISTHWPFVLASVPLSFVPGTPMRRRLTIVPTFTVVRAIKREAQIRAPIKGLVTGMHDERDMATSPKSIGQPVQTLKAIALELRSIANIVRSITNPFRGNPEIIYVEKEEVARRLRILADAIASRVDRE
jgi:hypothetical protein